MHVLAIRWPKTVGEDRAPMGTYMYDLRLVAALGLLAATATPACAQDAADTAPPPPITISGSATIATDYRLRGVSQSDKDGAIQGGLTIAHRSGMRPAVTVAQALEMALARGERGPLIHGWLAILRDAVGSDRHDDAACDTYRAACAVRMFG